MAFAFTSATDYPVTFDDCKAMTLEVYSSLRSTNPYTMEAMKLNFSLRVLTYRLAKHSCPLSWNNQDRMMVRSFEYAFPEFILNVAPEDLRHKLCPCIPELERKLNEVRVTAMTAAVEAIGEIAAIVEPEASIEELQRNVDNFNLEPQQVLNDDNSAPPQSDENDLGLEEASQMQDQKHDPTKIAQELDHNDGPTETALQTLDEPNPTATNTQKLDYDGNTALNLRDNPITVKQTPDHNDDPIAAITAIRTVGMGGDRYLDVDHIAETIAIYRGSKISYELWDIDRQPIVKYATIPPIQQLKDELKSHYPEDQIWKMYFTWRNIAGIRFPDRVMNNSLLELSILNTPCDIKFLL